MEPISLILAALVAGATTGTLDSLKDDAKDRAGALYAKLRGLAGKRVAGREDGERALERYPDAPKKWESVLADELTEAGAANDTELLATARELMQLIDQAGAKSGKYNVTITGGQGVQVGEGNTQSNNFYGR
jgi:hypothetical protein